ncbi:MAG TPA: hypothetical protein VFH08_09760 [Chitinophagaceae bacterium]|nr:hypothetical protein [Chitinophagaceae bacterium]
MRNIKKAITFTLVTMSILILAGCYKATTLYPNTEGEMINKMVSFVNDIIPVFNQKCGISGCHGSGGTNPDLTVAKAYISLMNGGYINVVDPKNSKLYLRLTGNIPPSMPLNGTNNPSNINALVLTWISQQAQNN